MTNFRNNLIDRMVHLYGLESPIVINFCRNCEIWENNNWNDKCLAIIVASHEDDPVVKGE